MGLWAQDAGDDVDALTGAVSDAWETLLAALPRVGIAVVVLVAFVLAGRLLRPLLCRHLSKRNTPSFARVFSRLTLSGMTVLGSLLALTVVFPSVRPVDVLAGAGVLTIAVGFAFQDILQNLLAGILLLFRQPFRGGDQIKVGDVAGTVQEITIRETVVRTFDGRRVLIPNATVYTDVITVQTGNPVIRSSFTVGIAYEADIAEARQLALDAVRGVEAVVDDPTPEVLVVGLGAATVDLEVLIWASAVQLESRRALDEAIEAVKRAFDDAGIEMPSDLVALQATTSFAAALRGDPVTPGGSVEANGAAHDRNASAR